MIEELREQQIAATQAKKSVSQENAKYCADFAAGWFGMFHWDPVGRKQELRNYTLSSDVLKA